MIADDIAAALPEFRSLAESLMLDAGNVARPTGSHYDSDAQGQVNDYDPDFGFTSRCKIQAGRLVAQDSEVGGRTATAIRLELHLPVDTEPLAEGDEWTVTTPHALSTVPAGTVYRVTAPAEGSLKTARRYEIERVVS